MLPFLPLLVSASVKPVLKDSTVVSMVAAKKISTFTEPSPLKPLKIGFLKRILLNRYINKFKTYQLRTADPIKADKMARASLFLGISAVALLFIPWYTLILVIPLGILAIVYGKQAIKNGTTKETMAKIGKGFGIGALIGFGVELIIAAIIIASWSSWLFSL